MNMYHGTFILHRCDNPKCCNPLHLYAGTQKDNVRDCIERGHHKPSFVYGEKHGLSKLTSEQVREIRKSKKGQEALAEIYGVSHTAIRNARNYKTWQHI